MAPNIVSLWNTDLTGPRFVQSSTFLSQIDRDMVDYVGPVESLDASEIFLGWSLATIHHWKETMAKANNKTKTMAAKLKSMKVEVGKTKELKLELPKSKELVGKLQEDLDKHVRYSLSKAKKNKALSDQQVKDISAKVKELTSEKKIVEENLTTAKDKVADLEKKIEDLKSELRKKEEVKSTLTVKFDKAKRLIVLNHQEGFKKAQRQVKVLLPSSDFSQLDVNCDVVDGEIVRESQLCFESKGE
ncbi:hypothetical protein JHK82_032998 [Glycine max]|nr:hypothetical protein JHK85_033704 [Glycine max]KAG4985398.1 hypothetical protein JHK86_033089 [Glycine max]KAG5118578.1 hypothetical protein JHK82_032998 [Glycine max]KAG5139567.1 hypothetical protein JHK84_033335 [Glycine max]